MTTMIARTYQRVPFFCKATLTVVAGETHSRQYPRVPFYGKPSPRAAETCVDAYCFDISLGGVGLNTQVACPRGCTVRVSFFLKGESVEHVLGRVAYVRADESGTRIGIEFQESLRPSSHPGLTRRLMSLACGASHE